LNGYDVRIFLVVILLFEILPCFSELGNKPHGNMSFNVLRKGSNALEHWCNAIYSASVELSAISVCNFLDQCIGTPASTMMNPVWDRHESRKCANSGCHTPAKSLSQYASSDRFLFGFMVRGLSRVHCK
jgi:hypothetical protein